MDDQGWLWINRNMRCIEIILPVRRTFGNCGLIETWDVLKFASTLSPVCHCVRLIETWDVLKFVWQKLLISVLLGLIETWDVLKFIAKQNLAGARYWLIETWDVLKYSSRYSVFTQNNSVGLIETWDVLKFQYHGEQKPGDAD